MQYIPIALAPPPGGGGKDGAAPSAKPGLEGLLGNPMLMLVLLVAVFYVLLIRPQQQRQKEQKKLVSELQKGDEVVTSGGIHGVISAVKESTVMVKVAETVKFEVERASITKVAKKAAGEPEKD